MIKFIRKSVKKLRIQKLERSILGKITIYGSRLEVKEGTSVRLIEGSTRNDIIFQDDIMLLGCSIVSSHNGRVIMGKHTKLGRGTTIRCVDGVSIGDYSMVSENVTITDNNNHPVNPEFRKYMRTSPHGSDARSWIHSDHKPIVIGQNCWIGENSRIQKGVTIGDNSIIAAGSIVTKDVPANCIAAGTPAKVVKTDINLIPAPTSCLKFNEYIASRNGEK